MVDVTIFPIALLLLWIGVLMGLSAVYHFNAESPDIRKRLSKPKLARKLGFSFPARYIKQWRPNLFLLTQTQNNLYHRTTIINPMNGYYDGVELTLFELCRVTQNSRKLITVAGFDVSHLHFPAFRLIPSYEYAPLVSSEQRFNVERTDVFWFNHALVGKRDDGVRTAVKHLFAGKVLNLAHQLGKSGHLLCDGQTLYFHQNSVIEPVMEDYVTFINQARTCLALLSTAAEKSPKTT